MNSKAIKRQLLAAIAMVLVAALALGSSTYAWFVASGTVTATGMEVTVQTEGGIMIRGVSADGKSTTDWGTIANAVTTAKKTLYPTSTVDLSSWVHASSSNEKDAEAQQDKANYKPVDTSKLDAYRRVDKFAIRSASGQDITDATLRIKSVSANLSDTTEAANTAELNKAIRVGVRMVETGAGRYPTTATEKGANFYVYAPNRAADSTDFSLVAKYTDTETTLVEKRTAGADDYLFLDSDTIPGAETGAEVEIFIWYEGEDSDCKNVNLVKGGTVLVPDDLTITVEFEQTTIAAAKKSA